MVFFYKIVTQQLAAVSVLPLKKLFKLFTANFALKKEVLCPARKMQKNAAG
jgi:hypothetical protein